MTRADARREPRRATPIAGGAPVAQKRQTEGIEEAVPRSAMPGMAWPAVARSAMAPALAVAFQLMQSQWWPAERLRAQQWRQVAGLVRHAATTVPHYHDRLPPGLLRSDGTIDADRWHEVPLLTREAVQQASRTLSSRDVPPGHGPVRFTRTSGSTAQPIEVSRGTMYDIFWRAITLRDHMWRRRDPRGKLAIIRYFYAHEQVPPEGAHRSQGWGAATDHMFETGPAAMFSVHTDVAVQAEWLVRENPEYLMSYATNLEALADLFLARGLTLPRLREVRSIGETLSPEAREACRRAWAAPVTDIYSATETGQLALQCPAFEHYHVMSETVLLEILDEAGRPCGPGQTGRVVLTPLHNLATVLLRYDIGDYAEVGEPCPCGRGLPVIRRILGRTRNMMVLPDGRILWPRLSQSMYRTLAPVRQMRVVQRSLEEMELRYTSDRALSEPEEDALRRSLLENLQHPFRFVLTRVAAIPRSAGGKFEDFVCEVPRSAR